MTLTTAAHEVSAARELSRKNDNNKLQYASIEHAFFRNREYISQSTIKILVAWICPETTAKKQNNA